MDLEHFTPLLSTAGGLLIGLSAALVLLCQGRVAGISGIFEGVLGRPSADTGWGWQAAFVAGLLAGGAALAVLHPDGFAVTVERSPVAIVAAGVVVGFGTRMGAGCTSGHGVCGIGRLSRRSIVATLTFMATGALTAAVVTHGLGGTL